MFTKVSIHCPYVSVKLWAVWKLVSPHLLKPLPPALCKTKLGCGEIWSWNVTTIILSSVCVDLVRTINENSFHPGLMVINIVSPPHSIQATVALLARPWGNFSVAVNYRKDQKQWQMNFCFFCPSKQVTQKNSGRIVFLVDSLEF